MTACPCGASRASVVESGMERISHCQQCDLLIRTNTPQEPRVGYGPEYWKLYQEEQTGPGRHNLHGHLLDWVNRFHPQPGVLVDVGCGAGALLALCRQRQWKGIGFDVSRESVAMAKAKGLEAYEQAWPPCHLRDGTADAVTLVNVLDHLQKPWHALQEAWRILQPGGLLYLRVPNGPVHLRLMKLLGLVGLGHVPVFHLFGFGRASLRHHLARAGFTIVALRTAPPAQGFPYAVSGRLRGSAIGLLKSADLLLYRVMTLFGLERCGWGLSLEVLAMKQTSSNG